MSPPKGIYKGDFSHIKRGWSRSIRFKASGEYRTPRKGEYFLSGADIYAYYCPEDLPEGNNRYWIAVPGILEEQIVRSWKPLEEGETK